MATGGGALSFLLLPHAEAPTSGFFFPFLICFLSNLLSSFFYFVSLAKLLSASPKSHLFLFCFNLFSLSFPLCFLSLLLFCFRLYPCFFSLFFSLVLLLSALFGFSPLYLLLSPFFLSFCFFSSLFPSSSFFLSSLSSPLFSFFLLSYAFPLCFSFFFPSSGFLVPLLPLVFFSSPPLLPLFPPLAFIAKTACVFFL